MAIDLTRPVYILAATQGERLAILGGSNDLEEARLAAALSPSLVLLVALPMDCGSPENARAAAAAYLATAPA